MERISHNTSMGMMATPSKTENMASNNHSTAFNDGTAYSSLPPRNQQRQQAKFWEFDKLKGFQARTSFEDAELEAKNAAFTEVTLKISSNEYGDSNIRQHRHQAERFSSPPGGPKRKEASDVPRRRSTHSGKIILIDINEPDIEPLALDPNTPRNVPSPKRNGFHPVAQTRKMQQQQKLRQQQQSSGHAFGNKHSNVSQTFSTTPSANGASATKITVKTDPSTSTPNFAVQGMSPRRTRIMKRRILAGTAKSNRTAETRQEQARLLAEKENEIMRMEAKLEELKLLKEIEALEAELKSGAANATTTSNISPQDIPKTRGVHEVTCDIPSESKKTIPTQQPIPVLQTLQSKQTLTSLPPQSPEQAKQSYPPTIPSSSVFLPQQTPTSTQSKDSGLPPTEDDKKPPWMGQWLNYRRKARANSKSPPKTRDGSKSPPRNRPNNKSPTKSNSDSKILPPSTGTNLPTVSLHVNDARATVSEKIVQIIAIPTDTLTEITESSDEEPPPFTSIMIDGKNENDCDVSSISEGHSASSYESETSDEEMEQVQDIVEATLPSSQSDLRIPEVTIDHPKTEPVPVTIDLDSKQNQLLSLMAANPANPHYSEKPRHFEISKDFTPITPTLRRAPPKRSLSSDTLQASNKTDMEVARRMGGRRPNAGVLNLSKTTGEADFGTNADAAIASTPDKVAASKLKPSKSRYEETASTQPLVTPESKSSDAQQTKDKISTPGKETASENKSAKDKRQEKTKHWLDDSSSSDSSISSENQLGPQSAKITAQHQIIESKESKQNLSEAAQMNNASFAQNKQGGKESMTISQKLSNTFPDKENVTAAMPPQSFEKSTSISTPKNILEREVLEKQPTLATVLAYLKEMKLFETARLLGTEWKKIHKNLPDGVSDSDFGLLGPHLSSKDSSDALGKSRGPTIVVGETGNDFQVGKVNGFQFNPNQKPDFSASAMIGRYQSFTQSQIEEAAEKRAQEISDQLVKEKMEQIAAAQRKAMESEEFRFGDNEDPLCTANELIGHFQGINKPSSPQKTKDQPNIESGLILDRINSIWGAQSIDPKIEKKFKATTLNQRDRAMDQKKIKMETPFTNPPLGGDNQLSGERKPTVTPGAKTSSTQQSEGKSMKQVGVDNPVTKDAGKKNSKHWLDDSSSSESSASNSNGKGIQHRIAESKEGPLPTLLKEMAKRENETKQGTPTNVITKDSFLKSAVSNTHDKAEPAKTSESPSTTKCDSDIHKSSNEMSPVSVCVACDMESTFVEDGMISCKYCDGVVYCSQHCLELDWKDGGHGRECPGRPKNGSEDTDIDKLVGGIAVASMDMENLSGRESVSAPPPPPPVSQLIPANSKKSESKLVTNSQESPNANQKFSETCEGKISDSQQIEVKATVQAKQVAAEIPVTKDVCKKNSKHWLDDSSASESSTNNSNGKGTQHRIVESKKVSLPKSSEEITERESEEAKQAIPTNVITKDSFLGSATSNTHDKAEPALPTHSPSTKESDFDIDKISDETCPVIVCVACNMESTFVEEGMVSCKYCESVVYCSQHCLELDWKDGGHGRECPGRPKNGTKDTDIDKLVGGVAVVSVDVGNLSGRDALSAPPRPSVSTLIPANSKESESKLASPAIESPLANHKSSPIREQAKQSAAGNTLTADAGEKNTKHWLDDSSASESSTTNSNGKGTQHRILELKQASLPKSSKEITKRESETKQGTPTSVTTKDSFLESAVSNTHDKTEPAKTSESPSTTKCDSDIDQSSNEMSPVIVCVVCDMESTFVEDGMVSCKYCEGVVYCSQHCLELDWKDGRHGRECPGRPKKGSEDTENNKLDVGSSVASIDVGDLSWREQIFAPPSPPASKMIPTNTKEAESQVVADSDAAKVESMQTMKSSSKNESDSCNDKSSNETSSSTFCKTCGVESKSVEGDMFSCKYCNSVVYCSQQCLERDRKEGGHREECPGCHQNAMEDVKNDKPVDDIAVACLDVHSKEIQSGENNDTKKLDSETKQKTRNKAPVKRRVVVVQVEGDKVEWAFKDNKGQKEPVKTSDLYTTTIPGNNWKTGGTFTRTSEIKMDSLSHVLKSENNTQPVQTKQIVKQGVRIVCEACGMESTYVENGMIPCERCKGVVYCTEHCREQDWNGGHQQQCSGRVEKIVADAEGAKPNDSASADSSDVEHALDATIIPVTTPPPLAEKENENAEPASLEVPHDKSMSEISPSSNFEHQESMKEENIEVNPIPDWNTDENEDMGDMEQELAAKLSAELDNLCFDDSAEGGLDADSGSHSSVGESDHTDDTDHTDDSNHTDDSESSDEDEKGKGRSRRTTKGDEEKKEESNTDSSEEDASSTSEDESSTAAGDDDEEMNVLNDEELASRKKAEMLLKMCGIDRNAEENAESSDEESSSGDESESSEEATETETKSSEKVQASSRNVTFHDKVTSNEIPRYDIDMKFDLFYDRDDIKRFKVEEEARKQRKLTKKMAKQFSSTIGSATANLPSIWD